MGSSVARGGQGGCCPPLASPSYTTAFAILGPGMGGRIWQRRIQKRPGGAAAPLSSPGYASAHSAHSWIIIDIKLLFTKC